jgi:S1-C subfamily serine protease
MVVKLPVGKVYSVVQQGIFCATTRALTWNGGQSNLAIAPVQDTFRSELIAGGLKPEGDPNNLFESDTTSAEFAVAGMIVDYDEQTCAPNTSPAQVSSIKGRQSMTIDWQIYSRLQKQIVGTAHTTGSAELTEPTAGGAAILLNRAFAENVRQLVRSPVLRATLAGAPLGVNDLVTPTPQAPLTLVRPAITPQTVDEAVRAVVLIRRGDGHGSGVLITRDGYILTAQHVVGDATTVRVRWSDGSEQDAQVVRVAKGRDVALLKTTPGAGKPLDIRLGSLSVGDSVFAVGAPLDQKFQSSVTRGVVSGNRVFDGYAYLQSDVTVDPGNSGGPLLDEHGRLVAITVKGVRIGAASQGVNFFVPVADAVSFLSIDLK